jgi:hypothetical protein
VDVVPGSIGEGPATCSCGGGDVVNAGREIEGRREFGKGV